MKLRLIYLFFLSIGFSMNSSAKFVENTDITSYVNSLIQKNRTVTIPSGNYRVDATKSIKLKDGTQLRMSPDTKLHVIPNSNESYRVFIVKDVKNVSISGGEIIGDKYSHLGKSGEWGMGIEIRDSQNINISNISIDKMWGDAMYVGTSGKNTTYNINLNNIEMNDNRRQGLTIISADTLNAKNIKARNTSGASPSSGIDIEPNDGSKVLKNITLDSIATSNNAGPGIQIGLSRYNNSNTPISITIENHTDIGSQYGFLMGAINKAPTGNIKMSSLNYTKSKSPSCFNSWTNKGVNIKIIGNIGFSKAKTCNGHHLNSSFSFK